MIAAGLPNRLFPDPEDEEDPKSPPEPLAPAVPNRGEPVLELEPNREEDCGLFSTTVEVVDDPNMEAEEEEDAGWC